MPSETSESNSVLSLLAWREIHILVRVNFALSKEHRVSKDLDNCRILKCGCLTSRILSQFSRKENLLSLFLSRVIHTFRASFISPSRIVQLYTLYKYIYTQCNYCIFTTQMCFLFAYITFSQTKLGKSRISHFYLAGAYFSYLHILGSQAYNLAKHKTASHKET